MQLGMSTAAFFGRHETEEAARVTAALPLDCAEIFLQTLSEYTPDFARLVRENLQGLPCASVHPLGTNFENAMISSSMRQRRDAWDIFRRVLDCGALLGAGMYVHHGRHTPQNRILPWDLQKNCDMIGPMCEEAAQRGMVIAWENVCWCQLTEPSRVLEAKAALPDVRFTLDIKQAMRAGCDPLDFVRAMGDRLCNVHICDWREDGALCLPGEGIYDFGALLDALRGEKYAGAVILEPYLALIQSDEALARSIAFMRDKMKE